MDEIKTEITIDHTNQQDTPKLEAMKTSVCGVLPDVDKILNTVQRRVAGIPADKPLDYRVEREKDFRKEAFHEALARIDRIKDVKGVAEAQRRFYEPEAVRQRAKLHPDPGTNAQMILAEQSEIKNQDDPGLVRRAEAVAAGGDFAKARLILGEVSARGEKLGTQYRAQIEETIHSMRVKAPELEAIDELERNVFELFEKVNEIRCGARRYSYEELGKMDPQEYQRVREAQRKAGIRQ